MVKKSGFLEMPFGWMFALLAGAVILFLAIFFVVKLTSIEETEQGIVTSNDLGILMSPLEIGFESAKATFLKMPSNSRIYTTCDESGFFGKQKIQVSQENFGKISEGGLNASFPNKYIFSENPIEGRNFYIFTKPFNFPFKVSDLIYLIPATKVYCFVNPPNETRKEISDLKIKSVINVSNKINCAGSISVCFNTEGCNISVYNNVNLERNYVKKNGQSLYFAGDSLMYAAIFGDPNQYECQVIRIAKRTKELVNLYEAKQSSVSNRGCPTNLDFSRLLDFESSQYFIKNNIQEVNRIKELNEQMTCQLW